MTAPMKFPTTAEEAACDQIAEDWVKFHGGRKLFGEQFDELAGLFDCEIEHRAGRIMLCGIVDQWEDVHGLTGADFVRLRGEIEAWISAHGMSYGRNDL